MSKPKKTKAKRLPKTKVVTPNKVIDVYAYNNQVEEYVFKHGLFDREANSQYVFDHGKSLAELNLSQALMLVDEVLDRIYDHCERYDSKGDVLLDSKLNNIKRALEGTPYEVNQYFWRSLEEANISFSE